MLKVYNSIISAIFGDALGVPVEFRSREYLKKNPVTSLIGYGTHHQPPGTWSDDSTMILANMESFVTGVEPMKIYSKWFEEGYLTPHGNVFDIGKTTKEAILNYLEGTTPTGLTDISSNGNGSLMRILPVAFQCLSMDEQARRLTIFSHSELTHGHIISKLACWLYCEIIRNIVLLDRKKQAVDNAYSLVMKYAKENVEKEFVDLFYVCNSRILTYEPEQLRSRGYVIDSLESSIYSFLCSDSVLESLLFAVNLGEDTDTIACITGGLSGAYYGDLPEELTNQLVSISDIKIRIREFENKL